MIVRYGEHPSQVVELFEPAGEPRGAAVLIHGGFWRAAYDRHLMDALCRDLAARGWAAWNLEYRRLGDRGGWPETFDDVEAGIGAIGASNTLLLAIGHSAGGHLALWAAARRLITHAVAQAGVVDLAEAARLGLSGGVVDELVPPELYDRASPAAMLPLGVPQLLVHGEEDDAVPVAMSRDYRAAAVAAGDDVSLVTLPGVGHFEHLDPASEAWRAVVEWLP
ncbi:MAG: prolyl oligopeptidase family serine peptidase [Gaiellaceae bacterium]